MNKKILLIIALIIIPVIYNFAQKKMSKQKPGELVRVDDMQLKRFYTDAQKTYLLSFPGSGNTWMRYCLEFLTKRPTLEMRMHHITKINCPIGYWCDMQTDYNKPPIWKVHYIDQMKAMGTFDPNNETLLVIVRNPKEALPRIFNVLSQRNKGKVLENPTAKDLLNNSLTMKYFDILKTYDTWNPNKRYMVFYEDLIRDPATTLKGVLDFLDISDTYFDDFMHCYQMHKQRSLNLYEEQEDRSLTHGSKIRHHALLMNDAERAKLDQYIAHAFPHIWDAYLAHYAE